MKNLFKTLIAITLAAAFLLTGCDTTDTSSETSSASSDISEPASSDVSEDNPAIEWNPLKRDPVTVLGISIDEVSACTAEEAQAFAQTDEALDNAFFFASWANHNNYQSTDELLDLNVFFWLVPELIRTRDLATADEDGSFLLSKTEIAEYLYCCFGISESDLIEEKRIHPGICGAPFYIHELSLVSVEGNVAKYKCVFNKGIHEEGPAPFRASLMTFEVMKDSKKPFLRLVSITDRTEEFKTAKEASAALNLGGNSK